jgi:hypothetical protein
MAAFTDGPCGGHTCARARERWRVRGLTRGAGAAVTDKLSFPQEEERTLAFWREIDAFKQSVRLSEGRPEYTFYDGPPFATGLPHYGHLLAGSIKARTTGRATLDRARSPAPVYAPIPAGHCDALCAPAGFPCRAPLWVGLPRPARRVRD